MDETWVDTNHTASHQWTSSNPSNNRKLPLGKGQRFVVLHAGCEKGCLPGSDLVFKSISTDERENHIEMNANIFEKWRKYQLLPVSYRNLPHSKPSPGMFTIPLGIFAI